MSAASAPVFRLYLLRHARSGWALPGQKDFDRTLDETGRAEAEIVAGLAMQSGFVPELTLCSAALRCRQTVDAFRRAMGDGLDVRYTEMLYSGASDAYREIIGGQDDVSSLMVVGHNPVIEEIFREILGAQAVEAAATGYPPGAMAVIDLDKRPSKGILPAGKLSAWLDPETRAQGR